VLVVFDNLVISSLFICIRVVWHFTCFDWKIAYITAVSITYSLRMIRVGGL
jgi:hypothetical protein